MKIHRIAGNAYVALSVLGILSVSLTAFVAPQAVMDLVRTPLTNNDAISSIRGVYGGAGLAIVVGILFQNRRNTADALAFLAVLWGLYALSRLVTLVKEGPLGPFGTFWVRAEVVLCLTGLALFAWYRSRERGHL